MKAACGNAAHIAAVVKELAGQRVDIAALTGFANSDVQCFCMTPARFTFAPVDTGPGGFHVEFSGTGRGETPGGVHLLDGQEELLMWDMAEWVEDPLVVFSLANAIQLGYEQGASVVRSGLGGQ